MTAQLSDDEAFALGIHVVYCSGYSCTSVNFNNFNKQINFFSFWLFGHSAMFWMSKKRKTVAD